jgi:hypothetical protein
VKNALVLAAFAISVAGGPSLLAADDPREEVERLRKDLDAAKKRIAELEKKAEEQALILEENRRQVLQAQNAEKLARATAEALAARLDKLRAQRGEPQHPPLPRVEPYALPEDLRGNIVDVAGDLVTISIGIDAGLTVGAVLEVYRPDGKKVIGTVKVTDAFNLYPKQAVVKFTPARKAELKDLKPEELPKKGDVVRPPKVKD